MALWEGTWRAGGAGWRPRRRMAFTNTEEVHDALTPQAHAHAHAHTHARAHAHAHAHARAHARALTRTHTRAHARSHTRTHALPHAHTHTHTHTYDCRILVALATLKLWNFEGIETSKL